MKKTLLASSVALAIGSAAPAQAQTITITSLNFFGSFGATGTMNDASNGSMTSTDLFNGSLWTADQQNWFDTHSSILTWSGTGTASNASNATGAFSYTFHLTGNQVAAGTFFDWNTSINIPVLTIYDCPVLGGGSCTGNSLPMQTVPFPTQTPQFNGTTLDDFPVSGAVPVPAAVWLFSSGLIGLVSLARRKKA